MSRSMNARSAHGDFANADRVVRSSLARSLWCLSRPPGRRSREPGDERRYQFASPRIETGDGREMDDIIVCTDEAIEDLATARDSGDEPSRAPSSPRCNASKSSFAGAWPPQESLHPHRSSRPAGALESERVSTTRSAAGEPFRLNRVVRVSSSMNAGIACAVTASRIAIDRLPARYCDDRRDVADGRRRTPWTSSVTKSAALYYRMRILRLEQRGRAQSGRSAARVACLYR